MAGMQTSRRTVLRLIAAAMSRPAFADTVRPERFPYLQNMGPDRVSILWTTRDNATGAVQVWTGDNTPRAIPAPPPRQFLPSQTGLSFTFYQYQVDVTGLSPHTRYFYRVLQDGVNLTPPITPGDELTFRTAGPGPSTFLAFGDSGQGTSDQVALRDLMLSETPDMILHTGDIAYENATFAEFQANFFDYYRDLIKDVPFFPTPGNHEYYSPNAAPYLAVMSVPAANVPPLDRGRYYSFDWGDVHFVSLDSNKPLTDAIAGQGGMLDWLDQDLRNTRKFHRIVFFHHPGFATGNHATEPEAAEVRQYIAPILDRYNVTLVLNGHEHSYQRSVPIRNGKPVDSGFGTTYVVTGGGGGGLFPVYSSPYLAPGVASSQYHYLRVDVLGAQIRIRAIKENRDILDDFTLGVPPVLGSTPVVNAASFTTAIAPGEWISILGDYLAVPDSTAARTPLPAVMGGASVTLNGRNLPLLYASCNQINALLPFDVQGVATLRVTTPNGSVEIAITVLDSAPAIFTVPSDNGPVPAAVHLDGSLVSTQSPAAAGEYITVYLTGLGRVNGNVVAGDLTPSAPLLNALVQPDVNLGGSPVVPQFAGLTPLALGLYQVNLKVPDNLSSGPQLLRIGAMGVTSSASLPLRSPGR